MTINLNIQSIRFTTIERLMLEILSDGKLHHRHELKLCCGPCSDANVKQHLIKIRKKIRERGQDVVCVRAHDGFYYQHVRLLTPEDE